MIKNKRWGVLQSEIQKILSLSENELSELMPRLLRLDNITTEDRIRDGVVVNRLIKLKEIKESNNVSSSFINNYDIEQYIKNKNFSSPQTIQSQTSVLTNFSKLASHHPDETVDQVFARFIEGKSNSSEIFSRSVIYGFLKFKDGSSENNLTITKEQASDELSQLPQKLANNEITQEEYRKLRDTLESVLFD